MAESRLHILELLAAGDIDIEEAEQRMDVLRATAPAAANRPGLLTEAIPPVPTVPPPVAPTSPSPPAPPVPPSPPSLPVDHRERSDRSHRQRGRPRQRFERGWDMRESELREALSALDIADPGPAQLHAMRIHDVNPRYIEALIEAGLRPESPRDLVQMRIHGVEPDFVARLRPLLPEAEARQLIDLSIHGIDADYAHAVIEALGPIPAASLREMGIHDVSLEDLATWKALLEEAGYEDLQPRDYIQLSIHDVSPEVLSDLLQHEDGSHSVSQLIHRLHSGEI